MKLCSAAHFKTILDASCGRRVYFVFGEETKNKSSREMSSNSQKLFVKPKGAKRDRGFPSKCMCGSDVRMYTSKTQENPGRPFHRCVTKLDDHLFKWVEESMLEELEDALPKVDNIETELNNVKSEVQILKDVVYDLNEEVISSRVELMNMKLITKIVCGCICLIFIVIAYLLF